MNGATAAGRKIQAASELGQGTGDRRNPGKNGGKCIMIRRCRKLKTQARNIKQGNTWRKENLEIDLQIYCLADNLVKTGVWISP